MSLPLLIIIKGSIHQEDITIINLFIPNDRTSKYVKVKLRDLQRNR